MKNKILLYNSGGGIGDSIQLFPLILSIKKHFSNSDLYYLGAHENHFITNLKEYNIILKDINLDIKYFGFRWWHLLISKRKILKKGIEKFDIIIDLQSKFRNTMILKSLPHNIFYSSTFNFKFCSNKERFILDKDKNIVEMTIQNLNILFKTKIKKIEYDLNTYSDLFDNEAKRLLPNNSYIGFSLTQGNVYRKKSWPIYKFIALAKRIITKNKVPVFFVEKQYIELVDKIKSEVPNAIFPEHNTQLACPTLVTALAKRMDKIISIDNGVMHMAALANVPMIVLFGPTNSKKFAPKNENIIILDSKHIYKSPDISKIGIEDVLRYI